MGKPTPHFRFPTRVLRSWPKELPTERACIFDGLERLYMSNYDYAESLREIGCNFLIIEWDIAVDYQDLDSFVERWKWFPGVVVGNYPLHEKGWACREVKEVLEDAPRLKGSCNYFGMGFTYIPWDIYNRFMITRHTWQPHDTRMTDANFSSWYLEHWGRAIIDPINLIHLNH